MYRSGKADEGACSLVWGSSLLVRVTGVGNGWLIGVDDWSRLAHPWFGLASPLACNLGLDPGLF